MSHDRDNPDHPVTNRLVDAVRQMRIAAADRSDVVVELREATRTRLQLLAEELEPVIANIPADDERFDFALSSGLQPRFWIDATAHVMMGDDRRTYRFVRDTQLGRTVLAESSDRSVIADRITTYVAMRIHEREMALAGDEISYRETAAGRSEEQDGAEQHRPLTEQRALDRISEALEALRREVRQGRGEVAQPPATPKPVTPIAGEQPAVPAAAPVSAEATPPARNMLSQAQSIGNAVVWVLLGIVIGAGVLLLAFQNLLVQQ